MYVSVERIEHLDGDRVMLAQNKVDLRGFERREGEVLLRSDVLGHRLIDVPAAELVHAYDIELENPGHVGTRTARHSPPGPVLRLNQIPWRTRQSGLESVRTLDRPQTQHGSAAGRRASRHP